MKIFKQFLLVFVLFAFVSCLNDNDDVLNQGNTPNPTPTNFSENFGDETTGNFIGLVVDMNQNPIENVTITVGSSVATTDSNGVFIINNAQIYERFGYVKASKAGYIHGSRAIVPSSGTNTIKIMLLEETIVGTTMSGTVETIGLANGASVALEGNYIKPDGSEYSGSVNVIMHHLDPTDDNMANQMPGMLYAEDLNGEERMLKTLGMLAVELRGSTGEDLNLAAGSTAEITVPLDPTLVSTAPNTIPLWYFDEDNGYWIEQGQANLVGNAYVGTVSHFSFWNCDVPTENVNICLKVIDEEGNILGNMRVGITSPNFGTTYGYTNDNGEVCGVIPANETLEVNIYNFEVCGNNSIYTTTIGPYAADANTVITVPDNTDIISETVTGLFNMCDGNPVTNGYVTLNYGGQLFIETVTNGEFEVNLVRCNAENAFSIEGVDYDNFQTTGEITYTFTTPLTDLGNLQACDTVEEFIQYTIDGTQEFLIISQIQADLQPGGGQPYMNISGNANFCFYMYGVLYPEPYVGTYDYITWNNADPGFSLDECQTISSYNNNITFNLTAVGEVGEYIDINFGGDYEDWNGVAHTMNGVIHVLRDN